MSVVPETHFVTVNDHLHRIWSKGRGPTLGFLAGTGGPPEWTPMLNRLADLDQPDAVADAVREFLE